MLESLNASLSNAMALAKSRVPAKARNNPANMLTGTPYTDDGYGGEYAEDQYEHYRGRFYSAARLISSRLASQPVLVGRMNQPNTSRSAKSYLQKGLIPPNGIPAWLGDPNSLEMVYHHPLRYALDNPNTMHTSYNFWEMVGASVMATGRGFIVAMASSEENRAFDLYPIPSTWMKPDHTKGTFAEWIMRPPISSEKPVRIPGAQVAHAYFADPSNPISALSPLSMVARSVLSDEAISSAQYSEFKNEGIPKVALIAGDIMNETGFTDDANRTSSARPVRLEPFQRQQIITWFQQQFAGVKKRGLPIVLDALIRDIKFLSHKPEEMAYMDSASLTKEQIFQGIGVSEILTGNLSGVTRASGSLADQFFMDYCFNPIVTMLSQAMTKRFGPLFSLDGENLAAWIAPGVHKDTELDIEYLRLGVRGYALQRNEIRAILRTRFGNLPDLPGFNDVIIPEKLEERLPDEDYQGVGRLALTMGAGEDE